MTIQGANNNEDQGPGELPDDNTRITTIRTEEEELFARIKAQPSYFEKQNMINGLTRQQKIKLQDYMRKNVEDAPPIAFRVSPRRHPSV